MGKSGEGGYWAMIPPAVRRDDRLPANAKLLYGDIFALTKENGYCYASNDYLSGLYGWTGRTVPRLLSALEECGYIYIEQVPGKERRIYMGLAVVPPMTKLSGWDDKNVTPPMTILSSPHNNVDKDIDITPHTPQGGDGERKKKKAPREDPDWKPERFAGLWEYYPAKGRKSKQDAMKAWDDLRPDDELIALIGRAIRKLKATEEWQRGVGIPYVGTFLRGRRWEDADTVEEAAPGGADGGEPVEDRELI